MKLPPLSALKSFEAAARLLSFSKAGDELFVTHAAISHQIRKLEEWFGAKLFVRRGRSVKLTPAGEMLFRQISPALAEITEACSRVKALGGKDTLSVGCIPSIASRWLVPNLNAFTANHPDMEVKVLYATADEKLADGDLDVLITTGAERVPGVTSAKLFSRVTKPVCSPAFADAYCPLDTPAQIAAAPLLHDENREGWRQWFQTAGVPWMAEDSGVVYQDFNLLATAVIAGHGVALCPVEVFRMEVARGDLIVLSDIAANANAAYFASYHEKAKAAVTDFVQWFTGFARMGELEDLANARPPTNDR
ncbi:LysR substrate-binding domain-containing protein [Leisingera sp. JC11]|uniref:LysR substrate-binding domain-containing protein n=1 Tax=Leisingera sp. JC11 TaxID=3042469 RepID=UPI003456B6B1